MEELLKNIFIRETFPSQFDNHLWQRISEQPSSKFQVKQQALYNFLMNDASLMDRYFQKFEKNHLKVYEWYLLAVRDKVEIQAYLFRPLLQKTPSFKTKIRKARHLGFPHRYSRTEPNEIRKLLVTPSKHKQKPAALLEEQINSHDLFIQTFTACGGGRNVPYDYGRHMKSRMERAHYNNFIRQGHKRNQTGPIPTENSLSRFVQWSQMKEKIAMFTYRGVLGNLGLNSQRGIQTMLKRKGSKKLVFVNHQRKPVNYYLRTQPSKEQK